ncbi:MAG TPA: peptide deformylase [Pyrinomonadaceae bacterium]|jgi:peptide deformylase|nr:peptide deformylase [Pyrinomonadaceae bacterium]
MKLKIVQAGDPVLRKKSRPLTKEEIKSAQIQQLIDLMRQTMREAPGVGLAAPQIGQSIQLAVIEDRATYISDLSEDELAERQRSAIPFHVIINPKLSVAGNSTAQFFEGCLSVEGYQAVVDRALSVRVECLNELAEAVTINAQGWYARILQHEIDHLNGTLYIDRMKTRTLTTVQNAQRHWNSKSIDEVLAELE